ncbi:unnamed protein product [Aureobasidium uvarum]|uniref:Uncharacterized protein n=1 Tax=Aureobasidium uvarum TaxID=2773716 RepID=A0A9N8KR21_9PEZI|nr:unnamed protein product [Aureobasidium uvarum]
MTSQRPAVPRAAPPPPSSHEEHEDEQPDDPLGADPGEDRVSKLIDDALQMLEGKKNVGIFCICEQNCHCKGHCKIAARDEQCRCGCFEGFWGNTGLQHEQPMDAGQ